ncbi:MAG TPA: hypothetical protein VIL72_02765, partial [Beijerinckiaceae bacterium]
MADYYPLLARAVSTLPESTPDTRRAIYERARKALLAQLRATDPPTSEDAVEAESRALDAAIARLEQELDPPAPAEEPGIDLGPALFQPAAPPSAAPAPPPPPADEPPPRRAPDDEDAPRQPAVAVAPPRGARPAPERAPDPRLERSRPLAPTSPRAVGQARRNAFLAAGVILLLIFGAIAAWLSRVPRAEFATAREPQQTAEAPAPAAEPGKINERAGGAAAPAPAAPAQTPAPQQPAAEAPPPRPTGPQASPAEVLVAQRAAILIQAAVNDQQNVETHIGAATWRIERSQRPGAGDQPALRADVDIADVGLKLSLTIEKNTDATLRASHTMTIRFTQDSQGKMPAIAELGTPQMRNESAPNVDPLAGVQAKITDTIFIVALTAEPAFAVRNVELMKTRGWIDLPVRLSDGRIAKITLEKGAVGDRLFEQAF